MAAIVKRALVYGHQMQFRRTVTVGDQTKQLTFEPNTVYELTAEEAEGVAKDFDKGLLIDPSTDRRYSNAIIGDPNKTVAEVANEVEALKAQLAERDEKIAELEQQVKEYDELLNAADDDEEDDDE